MSKLANIVEDALVFTGENNIIGSRDAETGEYEFYEGENVIDVGKTISNLNIKLNCKGNCDPCKATKRELCIEMNDLIRRNDILLENYSEIVKFYQKYCKIIKN
jgi:hypothetical protein